MFAKTEKAQSIPLNVNSRLVFNLSYILPVIVLLVNTHLHAQLNPMNMFIIAVGFMIASFSIALFGSFKKQRGYITQSNGVKAGTAIFGALSLFFLINWITFPLFSTPESQLLKYELAVSCIALIAHIVGMYGYDVHIFGLRIWRLNDDLILGALFAALFLNILPTSLILSDNFSVLFLFATTPLLLLGILTYRSSNMDLGIVLCGPFALALIDWILLSFGLMNMQSGITIQIVFLGALTFIRWFIVKLILNT